MAEIAETIALKQAPIQGYLRPAMWISGMFCKGFHDASVTWHFETKEKKKKDSAAGTLTSKSGARIRAVPRSGMGRRVPVRRSSKGKQGKRKLEDRLCEDLKKTIAAAIGKELPKGTQVFSQKNRMSISMFTGSASWLNVIDIVVTKNPSLEQGGCLVRAHANSTGVLPVSVPLAPVLNVALFWIPFFDGGANKANIMEIEKIIMQQEKSVWNAQRIHLVD
ncbi:hypothetical protein AAMO2058_001650900 [Amorphochlora amoebiformis]